MSCQRDVPKPAVLGRKGIRDDNKTYWVAFTSSLLMATPLTPGNPLVAGPSLGN
jgi:hypothetical protein